MQTLSKKYFSAPFYVISIFAFFAIKRKRISSYSYNRARSDSESLSDGNVTSIRGKITLAVKKVCKAFAIRYALAVKKVCKRFAVRCSNHRQKIRRTKVRNYGGSGIAKQVEHRIFTNEKRSHARARGCATFVTTPLQLSLSILFL